MPGLYTGASGLWGGFAGLLYGSTSLSTPPGLLADAAWSPAQLFTQGEQGGWYDPSDLTTLFQDAAGTTPVTAVEQPVGKVLDKSGRGNHLTQSTTTARPVLSARVNVLTGTATLSTQTADMTVVSALGVTSNWVLSFSGSGTVTIGGTGYSSGSNTISLTSTASLSVTVSGTVTNADLRPSNAGVGLPAYQRVGAATSGSSTAAGNADYDTTGFPLYLKFDGTDDFLVSGTISPGSVDKAQVFAGVRKLSDALAGVLAETSVNAETNNGAIALFAPGPTPASRKYTLVGRGTAVAVAHNVTATYTAPNTSVVTGIASISEDILILRNNGVQTASVTTDQGTGNYQNYALYVGRRGGTSNAFNGHLYSLILRFSATNMGAATIASTETWVNSKTRAY